MEHFTAGSAAVRSRAAARFAPTASLVALASLLTLPPAALAVPAAGSGEIVKNSDGTEFAGVTRGDEWRSWVESGDGYSVGRAADGNWYYVKEYDGTTPVLGTARAGGPVPAGLARHLNPQSAAPRAGASARSAGPSSAAPFGSFSGPLLFILAEFTDQAGTTTEASWGTFIASNIAAYFSEVSHGAVTITPADETFGTADNGVVGWVNLGTAHPNTADSTGSANQQLTRNAIIAADAYVDFSAFDANADTFVDADELSIVVVAAGYERAYSGAYGPSVWGHKWEVSCCGGAPTLDGVTVGAYNGGNGGYAQFGEIHRSSASNAHQATMGIMVHELGHLTFGLPDLYDIDGSTEGLGMFGVMAGGTWGRQTSDAYAGATPVAPCAWTKYDRGWVTGAEGAGTESIEASGSASATSSNTVFRASSGVSTQYFLVENRRNLGYDRGMQAWLGSSFDGGVAIVHVDDTRFSNADETHRWVDVEEADGTESFGSGTDLWYVGNATAFSKITTPDSRLYNGSDSGKAIDVLDTPADTVDVVFTSPVCGNATIESGEECDTTDPGACPTGVCDPDCTCEDAVCGNNIIEAGETCDGTQDAACPGECGSVGSQVECLCPDFDQCLTPTEILAFPYTDGQDTTGATTSVDDPPLSCGGGGQHSNSVWYSFTAPSDGTVTVDTLGSDYDTVLAALTGACGALTEVACNDDSSGTQSQIVFSVNSGATYLLDVAAYGSGPGGNLVLNAALTAAASCGATPDAGCFGGLKATFAIKDSSDPSRDQMKWKLTKGDAFASGELGSTLTTTSYALCVYDSTAMTPSLVAAAAIGPGPSWRNKGAKGYDYKDGSGTPDGVQSIRLGAGAAARAKVQVKAKGANVMVPASFDPGVTIFDQDDTVTVQLVNNAGSCWTSVFATAGTKKNTGDQFKAKSP